MLAVRRKYISNDKYKWIYFLVKECEKISCYVHEYNKIMNRNKNYIKKRNNISVSNKFNSQIKKLSIALKIEKYSIRKSFTDTICRFLDIAVSRCGYIQIHQKIHHIIFNDIIIPIFTEEFKNKNAKYIGWIGHCSQLFCFNSKEYKKFIYKIDAAELTNGDTIAFLEYFYGKSYILENNQEILDALMHSVTIDIIIHRQEARFSPKSERFMEIFKKFADRFTRCKEYCRISGNDKWDETLNDWELLITHFYKYVDCFNNNGIIKYVDYKFNNYLKDNGIKIIFDNRD